MCVGHERCSCHLDLHYRDDGLCPACGKKVVEEGDYLDCSDCGWWCLMDETYDNIGT